MDWIPHGKRREPKLMPSETQIRAYLIAQTRTLDLLRSWTDWAYAGAGRAIPNVVSLAVLNVSEANLDLIREPE